MPIFVYWVLKMIFDSPKDAETVVIVDFNNLIHRAAYANSSLMTKDGRHSGHVYGSINSAQAFLRDLGTSICPIWCYDSVGAKQERQKILPEYKANREPREFDPIPGAKEVFQCLPGLHIEETGREGDDAIAYACKLCCNKNIIIHSGDKDLQALIDEPRVKVFSPNKGRFIEEADIYENYHVLVPHKIYLMKSLTGDTSDNIRGVERLIKKTIEPILNDPKCIDIDTFYSMIKEKPNSMTEKAWKKTLEAEERVKTNYKVILPNITGFGKQSIGRVFKNNENKMKLLEYLNGYECYSLLTKVEAIYE